MYFDRYDVIAAHYLFYSLHHGGQRSREYERLSRISRYYTPSILDKGFKSLSDNGKEIYRSLVHHFKMEQKRNAKRRAA